MNRRDALARLPVDVHGGALIRFFVGQLFSRVEDQPLLLAEPRSRNMQSVAAPSAPCGE